VNLSSVPASALLCPHLATTHTGRHQETNMPVAERLAPRVASLARRFASDQSHPRPDPRRRVRGGARLGARPAACLEAATTYLRHQLGPAFARRGPLAPILGSLALVTLLALVYLGQVSAVTSANQRLQALQAEQATLQRQDQQVHVQLGVVRSPAYIDRQARAMGLVPAPEGAAVVITVPGLGGEARAAGGGGEP
jgi:hypothetical protein